MRSVRPLSICEHGSTPLHSIDQPQTVTTKVHDALTEALDCVKASGLIRKYSLIWSGRSEVPHITVWKATDASDEALRHSLAESLAGLATESQVTIERE
jgi:hypothetical protein